MDFDFKDFFWESFSFENYALLSLALLIILFLLFEYFPGRNYFYSIHLLKKFIDKHLIPHLLQGSESKKKSWLRMVIVSLIWILLVMALANPRWDFEQVESFKPNINLVILLDISKSMDTRDEKPSRLERAKQEIIDIVKKAETANIGIIAFANQAHIVSPVTDDKNAIMYLLPSITTGLVGVQGSNVEAGLKSADLLLRSLGDGVNYILVMSDGGFESPSELKSFAKLVKNGKIISFGIGKNEGAPIPSEEGGFIKDSGKIVLTKLEKDNLINLSGLDNYIRSTYLDDDTAKVIKIISKQFDAAKQKTRLFKIWHDRFYIPLILAALLILPFFRRGSIFPVIVIIFFAGTAYAQDEPENPSDIGNTGIESGAKKKSAFEKIETLLFKNSDEQAKDLFDEKQYKDAEEKFSSSYNKGVSLFRSKDYSAAENYFAEDADRNIESEYNLGNTQLLQRKLKESIATYESVLKKNPDHEDAKINLGIAKKLLENQKKQNNSQNQPQNQEAKNDSDSSDKQKTDPEKNQHNNELGGGNKKDGKDNNHDNEEDKNPKESDGNPSKKELDIQAKSILSKISSDPAKLMNSRFKYEEMRGGAPTSNEKNPRPW